jgi:putative aldouronate transport system permease protein
MKLQKRSFKGENGSKGSRFVRSIVKNRFLLLMLAPGFIFVLTFNYFPMYGVIVAFKDFNFVKGILGSEWVGFKYFSKAFTDPYFLESLRNTIFISLLKLFFGFPAPIIFALLLLLSPIVYN